MLNRTQFQEAPPDARLAKGQTLTLEEYKALQAQGKEPNTLVDHQHEGGWGSNPQGPGQRETRREVKDILGLGTNDSQYGIDANWMSGS